MKLYPKYVSLTCSFSGEKPPQSGQVYIDSNGTEWSIRNSVQESLVLSDTKEWDVSIGTTRLHKGLPIPLALKRKYSSNEIRKARQQLQDLGCTEVTVGKNNSCLFVKAENDIQLPSEIDDIPVLLKTDLDDKIIELIHWRENNSDRYGADLLMLVLSDLSDEEYMNADRVPENLQDALIAFRSFSYAKRHNLVMKHIDAGPLSLGESENFRDLLPEDEDD